MEGSVLCSSSIISNCTDLPLLGFRFGSTSSTMGSPLEESSSISTISAFCLVAFLACSGILGEAGSSISGSGDFMPDFTSSISSFSYVIPIVV